MNNLFIKKLHDDAIIPKRATTQSAGFDIYSYENNTIPAHKQITFSTGIAVKIPKGCYGRVAPRSGLAFRNMINVHAGVIDRDFTDEIKVILINHSNKDYQVNKGDRIAQLIIEKYLEDVNITLVDNLGTTERSDGINYGGFGSTGK